MTRLYLWLRIAFLRWCNAGDEAYLKACIDDGLDGSLSLADFRNQMSARTVDIMLLQARIDKL